jgi:hypothetical protein
VGGGVAREWIYRAEREVQNTQEDSWKYGMEFKPAGWLKINSDYKWAQRTATATHFLEDYLASPGVYSVAPGLRRYDVADRLRQDLINKAFISPTGGEVYFACAWTTGKDDFQPGTEDLTGGIASNENQQYGLIGDHHDLLTWTGHWSPWQGLDLDGTVDEQEFNATQVGSSQAAQTVANDWTLKSAESYLFLSLNADWDVLDKLTLSGGWSLEHSTGTKTMTDALTATTVTDLPNTSSRMEIWTASLTYRINDVWSLRGTYLLEFYDASDFQTDTLYNLENSSTGNYSSLFLGVRDESFVAQVASLSLRGRL